MKIIYFLIPIILLLFSCNNHPQNKGEDKTQEVTDVRNLQGNAFVFTELEPHNNRVYVIPANEKDSNAFKRKNVVDAIKGKICIQLNIGCFSNFYSDVNKRIMAYKACNLPYDSMFYSKAFIHYKNYTEVLIRPTDEAGKSIKLRREDSCNTKVITETDSSSFNIFHIYQ
ncbi:MAG: hypothetical protein Q8R57_10935 [Bacteroidota bacterium]|nr:hypothetical protein [Bacteroidota bacterium]